MRGKELQRNNIKTIILTTFTTIGLNITCINIILQLNRNHDLRQN